MFNVENKKAIKMLSKKSYKNNGRRNITAILAIILTTILFTAIFTVGMGLIKSMEYNSMRMAGGMAHGTFKYLSDEQAEKFQKHELLKEVGISKLAGFISDEKLLKRPVELDCKNKTDMKLCFIELSGGKMPEQENDIVLDTSVLEMLGLEQKAGQEITLETNIGNGEKVVITYNLCGWYEGDSAFMTSIGLVSQAYMDKYLTNRGQQYLKDYDMEGSTNLNIMFKNSLNIENDLQKVIEDIGYSNDQTSPDYVPYGVNWAYMTTSQTEDNISTVIAIAAALLLIMFTGYLIIYNIFQISVIKDIRFYGLLKTIGTTGKQIHKILINQAMKMCIIGIPLGLLAGFGVGAAILPLIASQMYGGKSYVSFNPIIFIGSAVFAAVTVLISCSKPAKTAAKISPVEAVKYSGVDNSYTKKNKKSKSGAKLYKMAFSNLGRNKKRTVIAVLSMSLSLVLMNTVFCLSNSLDLDKFVSNMIDVDYQLAHASYFNLKYRDEEMPVSDSFAEAFSSQDGIIGSGGIYTDFEKVICSEYEGEITTLWGDTQTYTKEDGVSTAIYAMDDFVLENLNIVSGEYDAEKFATGDYVLLGCNTDDFGNVVLDSVLYDVGDKITLKEQTNFEINPDFDHYDYDLGQYIAKDGSIINTPIMQYEYEGMSKEYTVMGLYTMGYTNTSRSYGDNVTAAMPIDEFTTWGTSPKMMTYLVNADKSSYEQLDSFLEQYTTGVEPSMNYNSRDTYKDEFMQMKNIILTVGGVLSIIIGLIGLLNFVNSISTGIIARQKEFAMLNSIGMTRTQLKTMLVYEGFYYAFLTAGFSLVIEFAAAYTIIKTLIDGVWFLSFNVTFVPIISACILLIIFAAIIPVMVYRNNVNTSVVEQLRSAE